MKYAIVLTDEHGSSHFKDADLDFTPVNFAPPAPPVNLSDYIPVSKLVFFKIPAGWFGDWHLAPKSQYFCCLSGQIEITVGDGEKRVFSAGDVFLLNDTSGKGHVTKVIGEQEFVAAIVQLATTNTKT